MKKFLYIGDVHAVVDELDDCRALMSFVTSICKQERAIPVLLGDLHHEHGVIRVEVMDFWRNALKRLRSDADIDLIIALVGNHDRPRQDGAQAHALMAYEGLCTAVGSTPLLYHGIRFVGFQDSAEEFVRQAQGGGTLVCHQTFAGGKYENGFYAPDSIDPNLLSQENIISGHIHSPQSFGKVWYPGAPRWRTLSDANQSRSVWVLTHGEDGSVIDRKEYSTDSICKQIRHEIDTPGSPVATPLDSRFDWRVDIRGPADWIESRRVDLLGPGVRIRTFREKEAAPKVRESQGIGNAFSAYLAAYRPVHGTNPAVLQQMVQERLG